MIKKVTATGKRTTLQFQKTKRLSQGRNYTAEIIVRYYNILFTVLPSSHELLWDPTLKDSIASLQHNTRDKHKKSPKFYPRGLHLIQCTQSNWTICSMNQAKRHITHDLIFTNKRPCFRENITSPKLIKQKWHCFPFCYLYGGGQRHTESSCYTGRRTFPQ